MEDQERIFSSGNWLVHNYSHHWREEIKLKITTEVAKKPSQNKTKSDGMEALHAWMKND